jgi:hypothetical protein
MSLHLLLSNYYRLQQVEADVCKSELTIEKVKTIHRFHKLAFDRGALGVSTELLIIIGHWVTVRSRKVGVYHTLKDNCCINFVVNIRSMKL